MVSKFNAFLLAGAFALPLVGTAALAQTSTGAQVTTPPAAAPHAGATAKGNAANDEGVTGKTHPSKHKSTAARQHHEKAGAAAGAGATVDPAKKP